MDGFIKTAKGCLLLWGLLCLTFEASAEPAVLFLKGFRSGEGHAAVSVFTEQNRESFPGEVSGALQTYYLPLKGQLELKIELKSLEAGTYALAVLHDEDSNQELKTFLAIPREGFGFSNNPTVLVGPPSFDRVKLNIAPSSQVTVQIKYFL